jgi:hypothetical protein
MEIHQLLHADSAQPFDDTEPPIELDGQNLGVHPFMVERKCRN